MTRRLRGGALGAALVAACLLAATGPGLLSDAAFSGTTGNSSSLTGGDWFRYTSVAAGYQFACTSNVNDVLTCWGKNTDGQLGNNTTTDSTTPVRVVGTGGSGSLLGVRQVTAGESFACGRKEDGSVWCWGRNDKGQLGVGGSSSSSTPVQVKGVGGSGFLTSVVDIDTGQKQACAVVSSGAVYCWGEGNVGQLGQGSTGNSSTPVQVVGVGGSGTLSGITGIGAGGDHFCAVGAGGAVYCWGEGSAGQLGDGSSSDRSSPVQVTGVGGSGSLSGMVDVDGGDTHTCARSAPGALYCWGSNAYGQLAPARTGDGTVVWKNSGDTSPDQAVLSGGSLASSSSTATVGDWRIVQGAVSPDRSQAVVIGIDTSVRVTGQQWTGSAWQALSFNNLATITDSFWWSADVAYESQSGDAVMVWDNGTSGTAGLSYRVWNGSTWSGAATITTPLAGEPKQLQLAASPKSDRMVLVVSNASGNDYALFWNGSSWASSATLSSSADNLTEVNVAFEQQSGDAVLVYGHLSVPMYYRVWDGSTLSAEGSIPVPTGTSGASSSRWSSIAADPGSDRIVLGVTNQVADGWVAIWDGTSWGNQLTVTNAGNGTNNPWLAVGFEGLSGDAIAVYGESNRYMRYRTWPAGGAWGSELDGPDVGSGHVPNSVMLYQQAGSDQVVMIAQDSDSDLNMAAWSGTAWGGTAQPSTNTAEIKNQPFLYLPGLVASLPVPSSSNTPLQVAAVSGAGAMTGAAHHALGTASTCVALTSGAAYCWGRNNYGQLGDNTTTDRAVPTRVVGSGGSGTFGNAGVMSGADSTGTFTCSARTDPALWSNTARHDEEVWCWGRNDQGQLGIGNKTDRSYPVPVSGP